MALLIPRAASASHIGMAFTPPDQIEEGRSWSIAGNIVGADELSRAQCRYRTRATGRWEQIPLVLEYEDFFQATIPGRDIVQPSIEFYCIGQDYFGGRMEILGSPSKPERVHVVRAQPKALRPAPPPRPDDGATDGGNAEATAEVTAVASDKADDAWEGGNEDDDADLVLAGEAARAAEAALDRAEPDRPATSSGRAPVSAAELSVDPPAEELSSSRRIRRAQRERAVTDFSSTEPQEIAVLYGAEDVVSLASRKSETVTLAPAIASGVSDDQMSELGLHTLSDVLKTVPGLETSRDVQGFHRVAVRGIYDEGALLVMYDGHRLNSSYDAKPMLNLTTENLERVEVLRGPGSALHGTGATLGTINLVPRRREGVHAAASAGLFGTVDGHASAGVRFGKSNWYLYGDASYRRTDGYRADIEQDALSAIMEANGAKRDDEPAGITDDHGQWVNVGLELRRSAARGARTRAFARLLYEDRGALVGLFDAVGADSELSWFAILADVTHEQPIGIGTLSARAFFDQQIVDRRFQIAPRDYTFADASGGSVRAPDGLFEATEYAVQSFGLEVSADFNLGKTNRLSVGLSGEMQRLPSYDYLLNFTLEDGGQLSLNAGGAMTTPYLAPIQSYGEINSRLVGALVLQDFWQPHPTFAITVGARLDVTQLPTVTEKGGVTIPDGTHFVPSVNPRVGLVWSPVQNWTLKLLYGRAFRAPTMQELSDRVPTSDLTQGRFQGNPDLSPSTVDTIEASAETTLGVGQSRMRVRVNGFFNHLSNPIMSVDTSGNVIPLENRDLGVRVYGAEAELRFEFTGSRAYTFINCSWFRAEDLAAYDGFQYLTNVPQLRFNWAAMLPLGPYLDVSLLAQYGAERRNNARSILEAQRSYAIPPYFLLGAQLKTQRIADVFELALTIQNAFDLEGHDEVPRPDAARMSGLLPREGINAFLTARIIY
jgi:outer membrane receptor protein involved in Fe transport